MYMYPHISLHMSFPQTYIKFYEKLNTNNTTNQKNQTNPTYIQIYIATHTDIPKDKPTQCTHELYQYIRNKTLTKPQAEI